jgi:bifunctional non-homologous end joining protein LigD
MVEISSRDKVMFPEVGITKGDLLDYYEAVAPAMLPHLADRPLTLERFPSGIHHKGFMQKNAPDYFPDYIDRFAMKRNDGETVFPVIHDRDGLIYLANQNTVTFHAPTFTASSPGTPDRMIFDLDPSPGRPDDARRAASVIRDFLDQLELPSFVATTGSKGYHVVVPLDRTTTSGTVAETAQGIAALASAHEPSLLTLEFQKKNRRDRVFVDWLRNGFGATAVVPWSVRPSAGATVAMPITWEELPDTGPARWGITSAPARVEAGLWADFDTRRAGLDVAAPAVQMLLDTRGIELQKFDRFRS